MKFLCVDCDEAMKLERAGSPDATGSITAVFACPSCGRRTAMLTNPHETEVVHSLGVKIGPVGEEKAAGCPFGGMVREMEAERADDDLTWTDGALARLEAIPEFVRPMARQGIEHYARQGGHTEIDEQILEQARKQFGM